MQEHPQNPQENDLVPERIVLTQLLAVIKIAGSDHSKALLALDSTGLLQTLPIPNNVSVEKHLETESQNNAIVIPIQSEANIQYHLMQVDGNNRLPHIDFSEYSKLYCAEVRVQEPMEYHDSLTESDSISMPVLEQGKPKSYFFTDEALCQGLRDALTVTTKNDTVLLIPIKGDTSSGKAWVLTVALNTEDSGTLGRSGAAGELFLGKFIEVLYYDKEPKLGGERRPFLKRLVEYCEISPEDFIDEIIKQIDATLAKQIESKKGFSLVTARFDIARLSDKLRRLLSKHINNTDAILDITTKTGALAGEELLNKSNAKPEYRSVVEPLLDFKQLDVLLYGLLHEALLEETGAYYRPAEILTELKSLGEYLLEGYVAEHIDQASEVEKDTLEKPNFLTKNQQQLPTSMQLKQTRPPIPDSLRDTLRGGRINFDNPQPQSETINQSTTSEVGIPLPMLLQKGATPPVQYALLSKRESAGDGHTGLFIKGHMFDSNDDVLIYLVSQKSRDGDQSNSITIISPASNRQNVRRLDGVLTKAFRNGKQVSDETISYPGITLKPGEIVRIENNAGGYIEFTLTYTGKKLEIVGSNLFFPPIVPEDPRIDSGIYSDAQNISVLSYPVSARARLNPSPELRNLVGKTRHSDWSTVGQIKETNYYHHTEVALSLPRTSSHTYYLATNFSQDFSQDFSHLSANELLNTRKQLIIGDMVVAYSRATDTSEYLVYTKAGLLVSFKRKGRPDTKTQTQQTNERNVSSSASGVTQLKKLTREDLGASLNNQYFASTRSEFSHRLQKYVFDETTVFPDEKGGITVYDGPPLGISLHRLEHPHKVQLVFESLSPNSEPVPSISINGRTLSQRNQKSSALELPEPTELAIWDMVTIQQQNGSLTTLILTPEKTLQVVQNRKQRDTRVDVVQSFEHPADAQVIGYLGSPFPRPDLGKPQQNLEKILYWPNIAYIHSSIRSNNQQIEASVTSIDPKRFLLFYASQSKGEISKSQPTYAGSHIVRINRGDQVVAFDAFTGDSFLLTMDATGMILSSEMPRNSANALKELVKDIAEFEFRNESDLPHLIKERKPNSKIVIGGWNKLSHSEVRVPFLYGGPPITLHAKQTSALSATFVIEVLSAENSENHNFVIKKNGRPTMSSELELLPGDVFSCYDPKTDTESVFLYSHSRTIEIIRSNAKISDTSEYRDGRISSLLPKNYEIIGHLGSISEGGSLSQAGYHHKKIPWLQLGPIMISSYPPSVTLITNSSYEYYEVSSSIRDSIAGSSLSLSRGSHIAATTPFSPFEYHLQVLQSGFIVTYSKVRTDL